MARRAVHVISDMSVAAKDCPKTHTNIHIRNQAVFNKRFIICFHLFAWDKAFLCCPAWYWTYGLKRSLGGENNIAWTETMCHQDWISLLQLSPRLMPSSTGLVRTGMRTDDGLVNCPQQYHTDIRAGWCPGNMYNMTEVFSSKAVNTLDWIQWVTRKSGQHKELSKT